MRVAVLALALVGCGYPELPRLTGSADAGDDIDGSYDATSDARPDATPDAPHICYVDPSFAALTLGQQANPTVGDWFQTPMQGSNMGIKEFVIGAQLNGGMPNDILYIVVAKPSTGFATNTAYSFNTDPNLSTPYVAATFVYGDYDSTTTTYKQTLWPQNGSVTFSAIGEAPNSSITGTVTMTEYREINEADGALVPNGCTTTFAGITFYLRQM